MHLLSGTESCRSRASWTSIWPRNTSATLTRTDANCQQDMPETHEMFLIMTNYNTVIHYMLIECMLVFLTLLNSTKKFFVSVYMVIGFLCGAQEVDVEERKTSGCRRPRTTIITYHSWILPTTYKMYRELFTLKYPLTRSLISQ